MELPVTAGHFCPSLLDAKYAHLPWSAQGSSVLRDPKVLGSHPALHLPGILCLEALMWIEGTFAHLDDGVEVQSSRGKERKFQALASFWDVTFLGIRFFEIYLSLIFLNSLSLLYMYDSVQYVIALSLSPSFFLILCWA